MLRCSENPAKVVRDPRTGRRIPMDGRCNSQGWMIHHTWMPVPIPRPGWSMTRAWVGRHPWRDDATPKQARSGTHGRDVRHPAKGRTDSYANDRRTAPWPANTPDRPACAAGSAWANTHGATAFYQGSRTIGATPRSYPTTTASATGPPHTAPSPGPTTPGAMTNTEIGQRLRLIRLFRRRTQKEVATAIYADASKISQLESGDRSIYYTDLLLLAATLRFSIDAFGRKDFDLMGCLLKEGV